MRQKKSFYNMIGAMASYLVSIIVSFVSQLFIVKVMGIEYSGINGLFTNIITILSVAELGIGETIIFKLYEPLAKGDYKKVSAWLCYYKKCYMYIFFIVIVIGLIICPIVPIIVGRVNFSENIYLMYLIVLLDAAFSYLFSYKRSLIFADQRNYIINIIHIIYIFFMNLFQIAVLILTHNFYLFLLIKVIFRILQNALITIVANLKYKYINEGTQQIDAKEKKDILNRIKAIMFQKVSFVINKGIDNILISIMIGIKTVGYYSNYFLIVGAVTSVVYQLISSFSASIGNLLTENNKEKSYNIYKKINMLNSFITILCITLFSNLITPFITIWIGEEYLLHNMIIVSFSLYIYCDSIRRSITIFKEASGICIEDRYMYLYMTIINLVTSVMLCYFIGIDGVVLGTCIGYLFLILFSYPKYIFKPVFGKKTLDYYKMNLKYFICLVIIFLINWLIVQNFSISNNYFQLMVNAFIAITTTVIFFSICFCKTEEIKFYKNLILSKMRSDK
ncbi:MAG: hypothetical protein IKH36_01400 [Bacilli bacterium]|nr:hypothetical protein [Bacilli bacterium]MBR4672264.1 hypothetical protein [Bacilli bacterium]